MTEAAHSTFKTGGDKLVSMANQMAGFFKSYPDDVAVEGIRDHIAKFWNKKMREELFAHLDSGAGKDLAPLAAKAVVKLR